MAFKNFHVKNICIMTSGCIFENGAPTNAHLNQIRFMLYHERERKNKINANFVYIVYLLTRLCNIFDEAFFIDVSIFMEVSESKWFTGDTPN